MHPITSAFPAVNNTAAPDPTPFFAQNLLKPPLPTNAAWQNFALKKGNQSEYVHPYLIQSNHGALTVCYPARVIKTALIFQAFVANLIISCVSSGSHKITHYDDLSVTLQLPGPLMVPLVRGSPYITCIVKGGRLKLSTVHSVLDVFSFNDYTKHKILFDNGQTWLLYSSAPLKLKSDLSVSGKFLGVLRLALLSDKFDRVADDKERMLDRFSGCYPISAHVDLSAPFRIRYEWETKGRGDLLMLSHSVHRQIMTVPGHDKVISEFRYRSMDGDLVGIIGDSWVLEETPVPVTWHSIKGFQSHKEMNKVVSALKQDVADLKVNEINTTASYFYGKAIARAARLAVIAEETNSHSLIPRIRKFLKKSVTPWLDGTFEGNGFGYDHKWGGLISTNGANDSTADFGFGVYNDHHYHFGYFCYAIAVLAKLDHNWASKYKPQVYSIVKDFMTVNPEELLYPRLRSFDLWKLHSWASGLTEFPNGRNQESTSEALNAYYSAALLGFAYRDRDLIGTGSTLAALEMRSAKQWWHVPLNSTVYESKFVEENRVVGILWANRRVSELWFAPAEWRECRTGIQLLPILPITELLFSETGYVKELVEWTVPALNRKDVGEGWKGFLYALESLYDKDSALQKVKTLKGYDDGNSLTNLLWWIYTRRPERF